MIFRCHGPRGQEQGKRENDLTPQYTGKIERLSRMLNGGQSSDVMALEGRNMANERMISHLNIQVR